MGLIKSILCNFYEFEYCKQLRNTDEVQNQGQIKDTQITKENTDEKEVNDKEEYENQYNVKSINALWSKIHHLPNKEKDKILIHILEQCKDKVEVFVAILKERYEYETNILKEGVEQMYSTLV